jgi:hypothetical protein
VVDRDQLYDPAHYISPSNPTGNGVDMNGNMGVQGMVNMQYTTGRSKKLMCLSGLEAGRFGYNRRRKHVWFSQPGNIESVPVMPSSPEPSNTNVDLSESIGKATISSSRKWHSV